MVMVEVPERAIGFVLETPDGYAIDYGTRFAVAVDPIRVYPRLRLLMVKLVCITQ